MIHNAEAQCFFLNRAQMNTQCDGTTELSLVFVLLGLASHPGDGGNIHDMWCSGCKGFISFVTMFNFI